MRIFRDDHDEDMPARVRAFMAAIGFGTTPFVLLGCFCCCIGLPGGGSRSGSRVVADVAVAQAPVAEAE